MAEYRSFRNADPPHLFRLWNSCGLGRGAAFPAFVTCFDEATLRYPYFDPAGLIVAVEHGRIIGFVHAGFAFTPDLGGLNTQHGVICVVMVHPDFRRRGIGRELVNRAEAYLRSRGASRLQAGQTRGSDPFYFGLYGGSRLSGFLESDAAADPFFKKLGYLPTERHLVFQRELLEGGDPAASVRLVTIRRKTELEIFDGHEDPRYWWYSLFGWYDSLRFRLLVKDSKKPVAAVSAIGLDNYIQTWGARAIGLLDLWVDEHSAAKATGKPS